MNLNSHMARREDGQLSSIQIVEKNNGMLKIVHRKDAGVQGGCT